MTLDEDREAGKETHCAEIGAIGESSGRQVRWGERAGGGTCR